MKMRFCVYKTANSEESVALKFYIFSLYFLPLNVGYLITKSGDKNMITRDLASTDIFMPNWLQGDLAWPWPWLCEMRIFQVFHFPQCACHLGGDLRLRDPETPPPKPSSYTLFTPTSPQSHSLIQSYQYSSNASQCTVILPGKGYMMHPPGICLKSSLMRADRCFRRVALY